jgi:hypothetical protein
MLKVVLNNRAANHGAKGTRGSVVASSMSNKRENSPNEN